MKVGINEAGFYGHNRTPAEYRPGFHAFTKEAEADLYKQWTSYSLYNSVTRIKKFWAKREWIKEVDRKHNSGGQCLVLSHIEMPDDACESENE